MSVKSIIKKINELPDDASVMDVDGKMFEVDADDLKALAESHERLLAACKEAKKLIESDCYAPEPVFDELQEAIELAEGE